MPRQPQILVFLKNNQRDQSGFSGDVDAQDDSLFRSMREAQVDHYEATLQLKAFLESQPVSVRYVYLTDQVEPSGYDLVVALGGDGTVLHASHQIGSTPVLAINSSPHYSVGFLTATTIDQAPEMIEKALCGDLQVTRLQRMAVAIDGREVYGRVLNDVLFSHECPASTARYFLGIDDVTEEQMSSGIWVGPAAGSTAAQRTAGGQVLPAESRKIQYVVREPYRRHGESYQLVKGLVLPNQCLAIRSKMSSARLYVDGPHVVIKVQLGETVKLGLSHEPLNLLGFRRPDDNSGSEMQINSTKSKSKSK